jgi:nucleoside-diphosphate-sugar epimerase
VTGCGGFLGSNLVARLLSAGHSVVGVDNLSMGRAENIEESRSDGRFPFLRGDVTVPGTLAAIDAEFILGYLLRLVRSHR